MSDTDDDLDKPMTARDERAAIAAWSAYDHVVLPVGIHGHFPHMPPSDLAPHAPTEIEPSEADTKTRGKLAPTPRPSGVQLARSILMSKLDSPLRAEDGSWMSKAGWHGCVHFVLKDGTTACSHLATTGNGKPLLGPFIQNFVPMRPYDHLCGYCKRLMPKDCLCGRCGIPSRSSDLRGR